MPVLIRDEPCTCASSNTDLVRGIPFLACHFWDYPNTLCFTELPFPGPLSRKMGFLLEFYLAACTVVTIVDTVQSLLLGQNI